MVDFNLFESGLKELKEEIIGKTLDEESTEWIIDCFRQLTKQNIAIMEKGMEELNKKARLFQELKDKKDFLENISVLLETPAIRGLIKYLKEDIRRLETKQ
jgi:hypothetical protein